MVFVDLSGQVAYSILFRRVETTPDQDRLNRFARQFVAENFGDEPNFTWLSDEAGRLRFKSLDPNIGSSINQVTFSHQETLVYLSMITALEEYWDEAEAWLQGFADTLVKSDPLSEQLPEVATDPPTWLLYTHPNEHFALLYPSNWQLTEHSQGLVITFVQSQYRLSIEAFEEPLPEAATDTAYAFIQTQLEQLEAEFTDLQHVPIQAYQQDQIGGYTTDYLYTNAEGVPIAGSIITTLVNNRLFHVAIIAPAQLYEDALLWFNPMMQSFQVLAE